MGEALDSLLTEAEVAKKLKISESLLRSRRAKGPYGPPYILIGNSIRYQQSAVLAWLSDRTVVAPSAKIARAV